jgi:hypothetical protein
VKFIPNMQTACSEELDKWGEAMTAFHGEMECVPMNAKNPQFNSKYADLQACIEYAKPILHKHGLHVTQPAEASEPGTIAVRTTVMHTSGQFWSSVIVMPYVGKQRTNKKTGELETLEAGPQDAGSAYTYCRRYAYCSAVGIVADKDDDGNHAQSLTQKPKSTGNDELEDLIG